MDRKTKGFQTIDLAYVAVCAVLTAVCSWISIPAAVPFTLQTFAVFCSLGLLLCYAFGTAWFMFVYARQTGAIALGTALAWCVIPFILPDLVKLALALLLSGRLRKALHL